MRYLVCEKQKGEGCDYTIGCGMRYRILSGENVSEIINQVYPIECYNVETALDELLIIPVNNVDINKINLDRLHNEYIAKSKSEKEKSKEDSERSEYLRLKQKFDK